MIGCDCGIVVRARRFRSGATAPCVEQSLGEGRPDGPEAARPAEPVGTLCAGEACGSSEGHRWEIRRTGDADLLVGLGHSPFGGGYVRATLQQFRRKADRKSTRLNSSHLVISYAVFCLKKKK